MKQLTRKAFDRARQFLKTQARPLERALFEHHFEEASTEGAITELGRFQNDDGGFGQALEPDMRTPNSSALATGIGLRTLKGLECPADHPLVRGAVKFLLDTFDDQTNTWRVIPRDANDHPHAPWWHDEDGSLARTFDDFWVIPRAEIVGLLHRYSDLVPADWLDTLTEDTVAAIEKIEDEKLRGGGDSFCYARRLAETEELPQHFKGRLVSRLRNVVFSIVSRNPEAWGSYSAPPLKLSPSPDTIIADLLWDDLQAHLDYQIDHQSPEGTWDPIWSWGDFYPDVWERAKHEWRGHLTLEVLTALHAFGWIETHT